MKKIVLFLSVLATVASISSCVSRKKFDAETASKEASQDQNRKLTKQVADGNTRIAQLESNVNGWESQNKDLDAALKKRAADLDNRERSISELKARLQARDKAMTDLQAHLRNALTQYAASDLSVEMRDGKVYIAISDKMLFKSGSDKVELLGKEALQKMAAVLTNYPDMNLIIEGHTDNVPIKTARYADNWDLSVARATSVVRLLTKEYGLSPTKVTPSGRGEFYPKASNETAEGKSQNRRTEIIIAPKLEEIEELTQK